jgi:hypothetical protein
MKFTLEKFEFSGLTPDSILMVEVDENSTDAFNRIHRTIKELFAQGKIPKGVVVLVNVKQHPMNLREISEKVMNENGWIKLKFQNGHQESPETAPEQKVSTDHL